MIIYPVPTFLLIWLNKIISGAQATSDLFCEQSLRHHSCHQTRSVLLQISPRSVAHVMIVVMGSRFWKYPPPEPETSFHFPPRRETNQKPLRPIVFECRLCHLMMTVTLTVVVSRPPNYQPGSTSERESVSEEDDFLSSRIIIRALANPFTKQCECVCVVVQLLREGLCGLV